MNPINSFDDLLKFVDQKTNQKVLMHSCCGPCSSACMTVLNKGLKVDIFFSNSNMDTVDEFIKRSEEQIRINKELNKDGKVIIDPYNPDDFNQAILGLEHLGEKSYRCYKCYEMRMERSAKFAKENGYDFFTTTLSLSPHKNSDWVNEIGQKLSEKYQIPFLYSNFKKQNGYQKSIEYSKEYNLYRQNYCGCKYSKEERGLE